MTENTAPPSPAGPAGAPPSDGKFTMLVAGLLVLICATAAVLWVLERRARVKAEGDLIEMSKQARVLQGMLMKGALAPPGGPGGVAPVRREQLAAQQVEFAGQQRQVLLVPAEAGTRLGFQAGDLVLISPPVAPAGAAVKPPATAPAAAPGGPGH